MILIQSNFDRAPAWVPQWPGESYENKFKRKTANASFVLIPPPWLVQQRKSFVPALMTGPSE